MCGNEVTNRNRIIRNTSILGIVANLLIAGVKVVLGVYAVDRDHEESKAVRNAVLDFVKRREHVKGFHAIYLEPGTGRICCDLVVDYALRDREPLKADFLDYMKNAFPKSEVVLTIETEFI